MEALTFAAKGFTLNTTGLPDPNLKQLKIYYSFNTKVIYLG